MNSQSILVIDDEAQIRKLLNITLGSNGYHVLEAANAKDGINVMLKYNPDLVLLDLGLPDISGDEMLTSIREWFSNPVIIISVQADENYIVQSLDNGANDYLVKPFRSGELLARIRSSLRNSKAEPRRSSMKFKDLTIDFLNRIVKKDGHVVKLTATEYSLLAMFVRNEGKVLTHQYLLNQVWGSRYQNDSQYLRVFVAQLRKKIENEPNRPVHIITESGIGYRFVGDPLE